MAVHDPGLVGLRIATSIRRFSPGAAPGLGSSSRKRCSRRPDRRPLLDVPHCITHAREPRPVIVQQQHTEPVLGRDHDVDHRHRVDAKIGGKGLLRPHLRRVDLGNAAQDFRQTASTSSCLRPLEYGRGSPTREDPGADVSASDLYELAQRLPD